MIQKLLIYIIVIPFVMWLLESLELNKLFKKNRELQAKGLYFILTLIISYLTVSFLFDFANTTALY